MDGYIVGFFIELRHILHHVDMAKKQFKAESKRLLDLMIHSIYTHKEIFLREIISNASDACDKLCYRSLTDDQVGLTRKDFKIELRVDQGARTITVSDNGIGMNREDLENNLGVIASSGSFQFKQEVGEDAKDTDVIGQFGVGFYSAFMVSDQITVITRKFGSDTAYQWQSSGVDGYTVTECQRESVGTDIIMGFRAEVDDRNEKIGKKIREGQIEKIPYMLVVGDKEAEAGQVAVRHRVEGDLGVMSADAFAALLREVVDTKAKK